MRNGIQRDAGFHSFFVLYNRTSAVFAMVMHRAIGVCRCGAVFAMGMAIRRRRQPPKGGCVIIAPGWLAYLGSVEE